MTTASVIDQSGPPIAAAPGPSARPATGARVRAGVVLLACLASLGSVGSWAWRHRVDVGSLESPPFKLGDAAWRSVLTVAATTDRSCPPSVPVVILYVSSACVHCQAELGRWANLIRRDAPQLACIGLTVVTAPSTGSSLSQWLPVELRPSLLRDHDGTVARALNIRLVPLAAYVTSTGVVSASVAGEASEPSTMRRLAELRRLSDAGRGIH